VKTIGYDRASRRITIPTSAFVLLMVLAFLGLYGLSRGFSWRQVNLDYGGDATIEFVNWWGIRRVERPLRVMQDPNVDERSPAWHYRDVSGQWVVVQIEPDDGDE
jgi:hypothetical protein